MPVWKLTKDGSSRKALMCFVAAFLQPRAAGNPAPADHYRQRVSNGGHDEPTRLSARQRIVTSFDRPTFRRRTATASRRSRRRGSSQSPSRQRSPSRRPRRSRAPARPSYPACSARSVWPCRIKAISSSRKAGCQHRTAGVSRSWDPLGRRWTLLDGLPSALNDVNDPSGPAGLVMRGRTVYLLIGIGDTVLPSPVPTRQLANQAVSSPLFSSVLAIHFSANVEKTTAGFTLSQADQDALAARRANHAFEWRRRYHTDRAGRQLPRLHLGPAPRLPGHRQRLESVRCRRRRKRPLRHGWRSEPRVEGEPGDRRVRAARDVPDRSQPAPGRRSRRGSGSHGHRVPPAAGCSSRSSGVFRSRQGYQASCRSIRTPASRCRSSPG